MWLVGWLDIIWINSDQIINILDKVSMVLHHDFTWEKVRNSENNPSKVSMVSSNDLVRNVAEFDGFHHEFTGAEVLNEQKLTSKPKQKPF